MLFIASLAALRQEQLILRGTDLEIALPPGSEADQGAALAQARFGLWPPALAGGALPAVLEPQTALVPMSTVPHR